MMKIIFFLLTLTSFATYAKTFILNAPQGGDFSTSNVNSKNFRGKNIFLLFGFTHCQSICPLALSKLKELKSKLSDEQRNNTEVIFVSVDNINDKVKNVQSWVASFDKSFIGTTANDNELKNILSLFGARYYRIKTKNNKLLVDHSTDIFLINKNGIWADTLSFNASVEELRNSLVKSDLVKNFEDRFPASKLLEALPGKCNLTLKDCNFKNFSVKANARPLKIQNQLSIEVLTKNNELTPVEANFEGVEAYMGHIRPAFALNKNKSYVTQITLPVCEFKKMNWKVTLILKDKNNKYYAQELTLTTDS